MSIIEELEEEIQEKKYLENKNSVLHEIKILFNFEGHSFNEIKREVKNITDIPFNG